MAGGPDLAATRPAGSTLRQAALWVTGAGMALSVAGVSAKLAMRSIDPWQLSIFRYLIGTLVLAPFALRAGRGVLRTRRLGAHVGRAGYWVLSIYCGYFALAHLPLADATALFYAKPIFVVALSLLWLGERVTAKRWVATLVGFAGIIVMTRPGTPELAAIVAALGALLMAVATVHMKNLLTTESPTTVLIYGNVIPVVMLVVPAAVVWRWPVGWEWTWSGLTGLFGVIGQYCTLRGYAIADASALAPYDYTQIVFAAVMGFAVFATLPDMWSLLGAGMIIAAGLRLARSDARTGISR